MCLHKPEYKTTNLGATNYGKPAWWETRTAQHIFWIGGALVLLAMTSCG